LRLVAIVEAWDSGATAQDAKRTRGSDWAYERRATIAGSNRVPKIAAPQLL